MESLYPSPIDNSNPIRLLRDNYSNGQERANNFPPIATQNSVGHLRANYSNSQKMQILINPLQNQIQPCFQETIISTAKKM
jgi:hypothetical protein